MPRFLRHRLSLAATAGASTALFFPGPVFAAPQSPVIQLPGLSIKGDSTSITILLLLTLLTLLPAILLSVTPFVRILVIFHFLRQALGTQTAPSNQNLVGLALFLTYFVMQPVGQAVNQRAIVPLRHILESLQKLVGDRVALGSTVLLCNSPARFHLRRLLEPFIPRIVILSPAEIPPTITVQSLGVVR